jgi:hypothetical protein
MRLVLFFSRGKVINMWQTIWNLIGLVPIGGGITIIGGLIGLYIGFGEARSCILDCFLDKACQATCPDAYMFAVYGAIPGIIIGAIEGIIKKSRQSNPL